jgi:transcriptional regulator with XRE-family HTH domain
MAEPAPHTVLRDARIAAGRLQADVAAQPDVTQTALSYWENGHRSPSTADLGRWAEVLNCRIVVASQQRSCDCGDDRLYWRGWDDCATAAVQAMTKGRGND